MSGIFDTLLGAFVRPEADRVGQEETDVSSDGMLPKKDIGQVSHHRQTQAAPSTPSISKVSIKVDSSPGADNCEQANPASVSNPPVTPDTSYSSAAQGTASSMSTTADIQICPQPTPFVYRRRALADNPDEAQSKAVHFDAPHFQQHPTPANVHIRPEILEIAQPPSEISVEVKSSPWCAWRQEQLDNMKPAKLSTDGKVKVLSSLHGPLSLPYARNPSGVDATVPDHTASYANTFGLRAVPRHGDADRVVSGGTDKTQSSSNSSVLLLGNKYKHSSDSEHGHLSNMIIKDPLQRYNTIRTAEVKFDGRQTTQPQPVTARKARDEYESQVKSTLDPSSSPFATRAMSHRAGLGVRPPSAEADPFKPLVDNALGRVEPNNASEAVNLDEAAFNKLMNAARYYGLELRRPSDKSSIGSRIPSNESSGLSTSTSRSIITPQHLSSGVSSKADGSDNWRAKKVREASVYDMPFDQVAHPHSPPAPFMTVDDLMERYNTPSGKDDKAIKVKLPPTESSSNIPVSKAKAKVSAASVPPKPKSPLSERATNTDSNPSVKLADVKKATPKGTPGAGKLLRKSSSLSANATKATVSTKTAPKLVAITEQATETSLIQ